MPSVPFISPLYLCLAILFLLVASVVTFDKRLTQSGNAIAPDGLPTLPKWTAHLFILEIGLKIALIILNWRWGLILYVVGFVLASLGVLETIGNMLGSVLFRSRRQEIERFGGM